MLAGTPKTGFGTVPAPGGGFLPQPSPLLSFRLPFF